MFPSFLAVMTGGAAGCVLRWWMGLRFNGVMVAMPMGTLLVNLIGGFVIGVALATFARMPQMDPAWKLLVTTGFCGGLTTFSTFSAEVVAMLQDGRPGWAVGTIAVHLLGSLLMTYVGMVLVGMLFQD